MRRIDTALFARLSGGAESSLSASPASGCDTFLPPGSPEDDGHRRLGIRHHFHPIFPDGNWRPHRLGSEFYDGCDHRPGLRFSWQSPKGVRLMIGGLNLVDFHLQISFSCISVNCPCRQFVETSQRFKTISKCWMLG